MNKQRDPGDFYPGGAVQVDSVQELAKGDKGDDAMTQATKDAINALSEIDPEAADFGPRKLAQGVNDVLGALKQMAAPLIVAVLTAATACAQDGVFVHSVRFADLLNGQVVTGVVVRGVATTGMVNSAIALSFTDVREREIPSYYVYGGENHNYYDAVTNSALIYFRYRYVAFIDDVPNEYFILCDFYNKRAIRTYGYIVEHFSITNGFDLVYEGTETVAAVPYGSFTVMDRYYSNAKLVDIENHNVDPSAHEARFAEKVSTNNATYIQTVSLAGGALQVGHNTDANAHADIRAAISNKADKADAVMYQSLQSVSAAGAATVDLGGSRPTLVTLTSNATLGVTGLYPYYPAYLMVQGDYSWGFSNATYWVGGAWYQTNRANHYVVWTVGTNLYVNPVTTSEVLP